MNKSTEHFPPGPPTSEFKDISDFLSAFAPEVTGRSSDAISPELKSRLASMAAGNLAENEGRELSRELLSNENAMQALADMLNQNA